MLSSALCIKTICFSRNKSYYRTSVIEQLKKWIFRPFWQLIKLVFTVKPTVLHCRYTTCDIFICTIIIPWMEEIIIIMPAYFITLMHSKTLKMISWVSASPKLNTGTRKAIWKCPCSPSFNITGFWCLLV